MICIPGSTANECFLLNIASIIPQNDLKVSAFHPFPAFMNLTDVSGSITRKV